MCRVWLRAGGTSRRAVAEGKEEAGCYEADRRINKVAWRVFNDPNGEQGYRGGGDSNR
jgi:hypothetical protein